MPRKLPWLTGDGNGMNSKAVRRLQPGDRRKHTGRAIREKANSEDSISMLSKSKRKASRTPSTSPPPAPPTEEYMRGGWDRDDAWMMVEDEFYVVAQSFTSHLHWQEYQRLKDKAKAEKAVSRRGTTIDQKKTEIRLKLEAAELQAKHRKTLNNLTGNGDNESDNDMEDDPWVGTTLYGLMTSPRKPQKALVGLEKVKSSTRAAAGYSQLLSKDGDGSPSPGNRGLSEDQHMSEEDDDLDALPNYTSF